VAEPGAGLWADRTFLREVQYQTDRNLAARQSIYVYQQPPVNLMSQVLDLAAPCGFEVVADIGCGNGLYLAELGRRRHAGPFLGVDMSPGMLRAARQRALVVRGGRRIVWLRGGPWPSPGRGCGRTGPSCAKSSTRQT
jgi:SAM-dependent methyltransferase